MRWRLYMLAVTLAGSILLISAPAQAACNPLALCSCTVTTTGVSFGTYNPVSSTANESTGIVRVRCILLAELAGSFTIDLSSGVSGSYMQRTLRNGASSLNYNLYTTAARNQIWGDGTGGSARITRNFAALLLVDDSVTVYGQILAGQNVRAATYSDTITVTVTY